MAATIALTSDEEQLPLRKKQAAKQFLETVNQKRREQNASPVAWNCAVRFLMARKFDVRRAVDLYNSHEDVRQREGINLIDPFEESVRRELLLEKFTVLRGRDSTNAAIALFTARLHFPPHTTHQAVLKSLIFQLDGALESVETQRNGLVFIYDMSGAKYSNFDYELSIKILSLLKGSYPARLKKVLIVTAPLWFKAPFKILRLFVREKLRDRVYTIGLNQLPLHIPMNALPRRLGGHAEVYHHAWLSVCLQIQTAQNSNKDVSGFFENVDNHNTPSLDLTSSMSSSITSAPTTPNGDDSCFYSNSDFDSDVSRDTLTDRSQSNGGNRERSTEKNVILKNDVLSNTKSQSGRGKSPPLKRTIDSSLASSGNQSNKKRPTSTSDYDMLDEESIHNSDSQGMTIKELVEVVKTKGRRGLYQEYAYIKGEPPNGSFETSKARYNLPKNRYTDVLCIDQTRVRLASRDADPSSDYINANFVDSYKHKHAYISTQGPLPRTFPDFWRMIWEQKVLIIVMTTRTVERSRLKCGQYWPLDDTAEDHGDFVVINNNIDKKKDYTVTHLLLQNIKTQESRKITHFQFTSWPDYGVPRTAGAFLDFMFHVREHQAERVEEMGDEWKGHELGPPIVVHCSAGIGRTGTFITMNINTMRLADIGTVDVQDTVRKIRSQRAFSIQMPDQYVFCHTALIEHAQAEGLLTGSDMDGLDESSSDSD